MHKNAEKKGITIVKHPLIEFNRITSYIHKLLYKKYFISKTSYQKNLVKNIIYDDKSRLVAIFKEQLIINDTSEYLKRFYKIRESIVRLNKYFDIYEEFSKLFPNYAPLTESKYIYINIHKKQNLIDILQDQNDLKSKLKRHYMNKLKNNKIFNNDAYECIEKNSEKLNSEIFDINNDESNNSILQIKNIINNIDKYKLNFDIIDNKSNKNIRHIPSKNIIINNYYYNNNSILTKKINLKSLLIQPENNFMHSKNFSLINNDILDFSKYNANSYKVKNSISYQLSKSKNFGQKKINNKKYNILKNTFIKINSVRQKSKNKSVINSINSNKASDNINIILKKLKNNKQKNDSKRYTNIVLHTSRINNYKNLKLNNIFKKIAISDINNSMSFKNGSKKNKSKIKINHSLINKIINNKTSDLLNDKKENNFDLESIERPKTKADNNIFKKEKIKSNQLKIYLETIKNKENKKFIYNKPLNKKKKSLAKKTNYELKTDRGIYYQNNLNKQKNNLLKKGLIPGKAKENNKNKKFINKKSNLSNSILTKENIIKNKNTKKMNEKKSGNSIKYLSININEIKNENNKNIKKVNSKIKIKGIQIKNFNKIFNVNREQSSKSSIKTSDRAKKNPIKIQKYLKSKIIKQKYNFIKTNNLISYTDREKVKRLFFSNNI